MQILSIFILVLCSISVMSYRSFTRTPFSAARSAMRMMSDVPETRTYIEYKLYKTKGAVALKPIPATIKLDGPVRTVEKDGVLLLEFAPLSGVAAQSAAAGGYGKKDYDYSKKEFFSLSVTELGDLIHMKETDSLNYVHTPNGMYNDKVNVYIPFTFILIFLRYIYLF